MDAHHVSRTSQSSNVVLFIQVGGGGAEAPDLSVAGGGSLLPQGGAGRAAVVYMCSVRAVLRSSRSHKKLDQALSWLDQGLTNWLSFTNRQGFTKLQGLAGEA